MKKIYTIGHSNRQLEVFVDILQAFDITHLVDVRTIPASRRVPWFNKESLQETCKRLKIHYLHLKKLGGLRKTHKDSINLGWRNLSFRGFADYMQTKEFFEGLKELNQLLEKDHRVTIMCAEALPWRCHRSLISDAELIRHIDVWHIMSKTHAQEHKLTKFAKICEDTRPKRVYYPLEKDKNSPPQQYSLSFP